MLGSEWIAANADSFDLFHVQFGFDGRHPDQLRELAALVDEPGRPLAYPSTIFVVSTTSGRTRVGVKP